MPPTSSTRIIQLQRYKFSQGPSDQVCRRHSGKACWIGAGELRARS